MTTAAALLGGVPLLLGSGTGSEVRQPLGAAIVGGLAFSQVFTLYTTPAIHLALSGLGRRLARRRNREARQPDAAAPDAAPGARHVGYPLP